ncbi:MAG TPA: hypothetical protein VEK55_08445 [Xanthobacteraceae bacterium]|nr:hypothetical protein [Xanthobacteraceae bacterium]
MAKRQTPNSQSKATGETVLSSFLRNLLNGRECTFACGVPFDLVVCQITWEQTYVLDQRESVVAASNRNALGELDMDFYGRLSSSASMSQISAGFSPTMVRDSRYPPGFCRGLRILFDCSPRTHGVCRNAA